MEPHNKTPNESFSYTYSAAEQAELKRIRQKYVNDENETESKWDRLRKLDASVTEKAQLISLIVGILSALVLGVGMCCVLVWGANAVTFALGIVVGLAGLAGVAAAYPIYLKIAKIQRARVAPEILRLTEELMKK